MKIVHIGAGTASEEKFAITALQMVGHEVFVAGKEYEQLVHRIIDADEIHVWDIDREFELGMVYFYSVHFKPGWVIKLFGDGRCHGTLSSLFRGLAGTCLTCGGHRKVRHWYAMDELGWKPCPVCEAR